MYVFNIRSILIHFWSNPRSSSKTLRSHVLDVLSLHYLFGTFLSLGLPFWCFSQRIGNITLLCTSYKLYPCLVPSSRETQREKNSNKFSGPSWNHNFSNYSFRYEELIVFAVTVIATTIAMGLPGAGMWENGGKKLERKQGLPITFGILELFFPLLETEEVGFPWNSLNLCPVTYHAGTHFQVLGCVEVSEWDTKGKINMLDSLLVQVL